MNLRAIPPTNESPPKALESCRLRRMEACMYSIKQVHPPDRNRNALDRFFAEPEEHRVFLDPVPVASEGVSEASCRPHRHLTQRHSLFGNQALPGQRPALGQVRLRTERLDDRGSMERSLSVAVGESVQPFSQLDDLPGLFQAGQFGCARGLCASGATEHPLLKPFTAVSLLPRNRWCASPDRRQCRPV